MPDSPGELDLLRAYLRDRDVTCPVCRHNLRGAAGFACPECGARLNLQVVSMDMSHTWWMLCTLAFALPLGLFGALAAAGTWGVAHGWLNTHDKILFGGCWALAILATINLLLLMRRRTQFVQRPRSRQRVRTLAAWIIMLTLGAGLLYAINAEPYAWPWTMLDQEPLP